VVGVFTRYEELRSVNLLSPKPEMREPCEPKVLVGG
jgi:hypothetical protein